MTAIQKYTTHYIIHFKNEKYEPQEISADGGEILLKFIESKSFVMINGSYYNKYEIESIQPITGDFDEKKKIEQLISEQIPRIQEEIRYKMKFKKDLSLKRVQSAIETIKEQIL